MADKKTSEDRLLEVIENPSAAKGKHLFPKQARGNGGGRGGRDALSRPWRDVSTWARSLGSRENMSRLLRVVNRILAVLCVGAAFFLIFDFRYQNKKVADRFMEIEEGKGHAVRAKESGPALTTNLKESRGLARTRNIFSLLPPVVEKRQDPAAAALSVDYSAMLAKLKVVGILWSAGRPQVMIEDADAGRTHTLFEGDTVGEFSIKKIKRNHVIFERDEKEWIVR